MTRCSQKRDYNPAVHVKVSLHGDVHRYARGRPEPLVEQLPDGATVADLLAALEIPSAMTLTIGVKGELVDRETVLRDGDEVMLLTPMEGG